MLLFSLLIYRYRNRAEPINQEVTPHAVITAFSARAGVFNTTPYMGARDRNRFSERPRAARITMALTLLASFIIILMYRRATDAGLCVYGYVCVWLCVSLCVCVCLLRQ